MAIRLALFVACLPLSAALAGEVTTDEGGELNPPEMGMARVMENIRNGQTDMVTCAAGYYITKKGEPGMAREVFEECAAQGWTGAMTWMSQLDDNGLGAPENPEAATDWSRRAAAAGDPVGQFNYGLSLLRGRGVARDPARGRALVDEAAEAGLAVAQRLKRADYDLDEVTPDADNWKYAPRLY